MVLWTPLIFSVAVLGDREKLLALEVCDRCVCVCVLCVCDVRVCACMCGRCVMGVCECVPQVCVVCKGHVE